MRALADRLGIRAPSLYAHVQGIDEVIDLAHERINASIDTSILDGSSDLRDLRELGRRYRDAYRAHRVAATIITARSINLDHALDVYEPVAAFLLRYGVTPEKVMPLMAMLDNIVLGSAVEPFADGFIGPARAYKSHHPALAESLRSTTRRSIDDVGFDMAMDAFVSAVRAQTS